MTKRDPLTLPDPENSAETAVVPASETVPAEAIFLPAEETVPANAAETPADEPYFSEETATEAETVRLDPSESATLELSYVPAISLAQQQNNYPVIHELKIGNPTSEDLRDLTCVISAAPEIFPPLELHISAVDAGEEIAVIEPKLLLNYAALSAISDTTAGTMTVKLVSESGMQLLRKSFPIAVYAPDQWTGTDETPEHLASFVTPNLDVVSVLMGAVAKELERATGSAAIQGYQADKTRVYEICAAIYRAIQSLGIRYSNPPSSFGTPGQRIRFADAVCRYRLGTCLDLALLFASVMESCGLHPVILIQSGHAYVGCHLKKYYFPDIPMDDLQAIRKLVELDEFAVIETTCVCEDISFAEAENIARTRNLTADDDFIFAIDVVRARNSGIRPLPLQRDSGAIEPEEPEKAPKALTTEQKRALRREIDFAELSAAGTTKLDGRLGRWRQKLLDLSLRNRLLNVRDTHQFISLVCADVTRLEDKMAANQTLELRPIAELLSGKDVHDISSPRASELSTEIRELLESELEQQRLWTLLSEEEMKRRLTALYRQSRTDLEESGVNTLFLGIGFLEWKTSPREDASFLAPILLMPVRLLRRSMAENIKVVRLDEDTVINVTLLELLRQEHGLSIPGLNPLPTDDSGVDVARVLQIFRQAILKMKGWEVREEARIGLFSFGKFIMWNDLANRADALREHPIVNHLISGGGTFDDGVEIFPPEKIGENLDPAQLFCPMNADSSQLAAVRYSELGKNFVLHGPPGTGKSQTITNIIAHNLALGRRVLFVSEKKAALDVVHSRLCAVGLRPFCLELHSNKAGKSDVMKQFAEALDVAAGTEPADWAGTVAALERSREELNVYVTELHREYPNGLSAHACFSYLMKRGEDAPAANFAVECDCLEQSREALRSLREAAAAIPSAFEGTTPCGREAFRMLAPAEWTPAFEKELSAEARRAEESARAFDAALRAFAEIFALNPDALPPEKIDAVPAFAELLKSPANVPATFFADAFPQTEKFLRELRETAARRDAFAGKLSAFRTEKLPELDCDGAEQKIRETREKFVLARIFAERAFLRELADLKKRGGGKLTLGELENSLGDIRGYCAEKAAFDAASARAAELLGARWNNGNPDWASVSAALERASKLRAAAENLVGAGTPACAEIFAKFAELLPDAETRFAAGTPASKTLNALTDAAADSSEKKNAFAERFAPAAAEEKIPPAEFAERLRRIPENIRELRRGLLYLKKRYAAETCGLRPALEALERGDVPAGAFPECAEAALRQTMLDRILSAVPALSGFVGENRNAEIRRFRELDDRYVELSAKIVFARLAARVPRQSLGSKQQDAELGILKRECEKRARQKPVRQLLELIPTIVPALKPCFLMSPLSVAQYLSPENAAFDLVVFDEASQIPVWDAIGAIARGKQLIVVGDPKQMPPTNFFQKNQNEDAADDNDADDAAEEETSPDDDMESILDECLAAGIFSAHLNWHYRSRHESLIAFSNRHYYGGRLLTFPSARGGNALGVRFEYVPDGIYDRRGKRTNPREAERLVEYVFARIADPAQREKSMGVVTFSQAQKNLIEDIFERERAKHPELEAFFSDANTEPFFVKNLENVQGDERDVILFSVGYAPDKTGAMSMNFGPLNRQGGERRLNVAVTRAKEQVVVFSSIRAAQIELSRTSAVGAAHLRCFLDYAEKGLRLLPQQSGSESDANDGLAGTIAAFLKERGFAVKRDVGSSGVRIDVAVLHPQRPNEYLLGVLCDGSAYRRRRTTRDRDHLCESVLKSLGWKIFRAWTLDWAFEREYAEAALIQALEDALRESAEKNAAAVPALPAPEESRELVPARKK